MNIQQFQYILAVAEHRHFETSAEKCFVSQSTLSTMISKFEDEIGIKIFDRSVKPVEITKEGEIIIEQLKNITNEINHLNEIVKEIKGEIKGKIIIGCIPTVAPFLLPLFLKDFSNQYPDLTIEVREKTTEEIVRQLKSRELDIGILSSPLKESEIIEEHLYDESFILFDTSNRNSNQTVKIGDLELNNFWLLEEGHCMRDQVLDICELGQAEFNTTANINFKSGSIDSLLRFVKSTKGKTIIPLLSLIDFPESDKKHLRFFAPSIPHRSIALVHHVHFPKKKIFNLLKAEIIQKVEPKIQDLNENFKSEI